MNFETLVSKLEKAKNIALPGQEAQYKMVPVGRNKTNLDTIDLNIVKQAAVAALFYNINNRPHLILTLRKQYKGVHSGQISFPGGKKEKEDENFEHTALRETHEEVGIPPSSIKIYRNLTPLYIEPSNFFVQPYIGIIEKEITFKKQISEVQEILLPDFNHFMNQTNIVEKELHIRNFKATVPTYQIENQTVWGATAMMISEITHLFKDLKTY